jgi:hypothetical protein
LVLTPSISESQRLGSLSVAQPERAIRNTNGIYLKLRNVGPTRFG